MKFQGAVIKEQGVTFGIIVVKEYVLRDRTRADSLVARSQVVFGGIPVVLMAQDYSGRPKYYGRPDIVKFLAKVPMEAIPWKEYTIS
jgi:hypothetical protein